MSGDGSGDLLAVGVDGKLWYYPNNSASNPGHLPFTSGTEIGDGWDAFVQVLAADVSGDGAADLLAIRSDGTLWYYANNASSNGYLRPFTGGSQIGTGWDAFRLVTAADVSGDGAADLLAIDRDGVLWYYPNNSSTNSGHVPFTTGSQIGSGWGNFDRLLAADVSGDGNADLLGVTVDGNLWYYPNDSSTNPGHLPFASGSVIGTGWDAFSQLVAADVSGDGSADLLGVTGEGTLSYYPNNSRSNPGGVPFIDGSQIGDGWGGFNLVF